MIRLRGLSEPLLTAYLDDSPDAASQQDRVELTRLVLKPRRFLSLQSFALDAAEAAQGSEADIILRQARAPKQQILVENPFEAVSSDELSHVSPKLFAIAVDDWIVDAMFPTSAARQIEQS